MINVSHFLGITTFAVMRRLLKLIISPRADLIKLGDTLPLKELDTCAVMSSMAYLSPDDVKRLLSGEEREEEEGKEEKGDIRRLARHMSFEGKLMFYDATQDGGSWLSSTQAYSWIDSTNRTAYLFFRGTDCLRDALSNIDVRSRRLCGENHAAKVHRGFLYQFDAIEPFISRELWKRKNEFDEIICTGHSLGGALATLAAAFYGSRKRLPLVLMKDDDCDDVEDYKKLYVNTKCYTFGAPRVGNTEFVNYFSRYVPPGRHWRVFHMEDPVPMLPFSWRFRHVYGGGVCLGYGEKAMTVKKDTPWYLRALQGLIAIRVLRPIRAHDMQEYARRLTASDVSDT